MQGTSWMRNNLRQQHSRAVADWKAPYRKGHRGLGGQVAHEPVVRPCREGQQHPGLHSVK